ncbi:MAG: hypothetical protein P8Y94_00940, partial [Acidobacteriota bacterium]
MQNPVPALVGLHRNIEGAGKDLPGLNGEIRVIECLPDSLGERRDDSKTRRDHDDLLSLIVENEQILGIGDVQITAGQIAVLVSG